MAKRFSLEKAYTARRYRARKREYPEISLGLA
jgi:hypothetical protein